MKNIIIVMDMAQIIIDISRIILLAVVCTMDDDDHNNSSKDHVMIMTHTHLIIRMNSPVVDCSVRRREYVYST